MGIGVRRVLEGRALTGLGSSHHCPITVGCLQGGRVCLLQYECALIQRLNSHHKKQIHCSVLTCPLSVLGDHVAITHTCALRKSLAAELALGN